MPPRSILLNIAFVSLIVSGGCGEFSAQEARTAPSQQVAPAPIVNDGAVPESVQRCMSAEARELASMDEVLLTLRQRLNSTTVDGPAGTNRQLSRWQSQVRQPRSRGVFLVPWTDDRFQYTGNVVRAGSEGPDAMFGRNVAVTYGNGLGFSNMLSISFVTDAPEFEIFTKSVGSPSDSLIYIDGRRQTSIPVQYAESGSLYLTKVILPNRSLRRVQIDAAGPFFGGLRLRPDDVLCPPTTPTRLRSMFIGDSFTEGSAGQAYFSGYAYYSAQLLGWEDNWISAVGGTGYLRAPAGKFTFGERLTNDVLRFRPDVLVIAGGINDSGSDPADLQTEAEFIFKTIRSHLPRAIVFVLGPWNPRSSVEDSIAIAIRNATIGKEGFFWIPNFEQSWIGGTGYRGAPANDGNSDWITSEDQTHPTPAGIQYLAGRVAGAIAEIVRDPAIAGAGGR